MSDISSGSAGPHAAGAFDVRNVIAGLIGFYGVVLVVMGLFNDTEAERAKTGDWNANLWVGVALVVFAGSFALWSRLRPIVVEPRPDEEDAPTGH